MSLELIESEKISHTSHSIENKEEIRHIDLRRIFILKEIVGG